MNIAVIDADLIGRKNHRFPNLACMKLSQYFKNKNNDVLLKTDYDDLENFDKVYVSKVFTDTPIPDEVLRLGNVEYGGTGFFYDKAPDLPEEIEHTKPDYALYAGWVEKMTNSGSKKEEFKYYTDYSIGFLTRGCFRKCPFCVNQNYDHVSKHSPLEEFYEPNRKKICLLDDNFLGYPKWKEELKFLQQTGKKFQFKQGLDERILNKDKITELFLNSKYDGDYIFAFDNVEDKGIIEKKLSLIRELYKGTTNLKFYVLCAYDRGDKYNEEFWRQDILDLFERIETLMNYRAIPYTMRFEKYKDSPFKDVYSNVARWTNQVSLFKKMSFREFCLAHDYCSRTIPPIPARLEQEIPEISEFLDKKY